MKNYRKFITTSFNQTLLTTVAALAVVFFTAPLSKAAPRGGQVVDGSATIAKSGNTTRIDQSTNRAVIEWQDFSVKANETVNFVVPTSDAATLNRVIGTSSSQIAGTVNSNGTVYLVNPNGMFFDAGSKVNVNSLILSTANITNSQFNTSNGRQIGTPLPTHDHISLYGTITAQGSATFVGPTITAIGTIIAQDSITLTSLGTINLISHLQASSLTMTSRTGDLYIVGSNLIVANSITMTSHGFLMLTGDLKASSLTMTSTNSIIRLDALTATVAKSITLNSHGYIHIYNSKVKASSITMTSRHEIDILSSNLNASSLTMTSTLDRIFLHRLTATAAKSITINAHEYIQISTSILKASSITTTSQKSIYLYNASLMASSITMTAKTGKILFEDGEINIIANKGSIYDLTDLSRKVLNSVTVYRGAQYSENNMEETNLNSGIVVVATAKVNGQISFWGEREVRGHTFRLTAGTGTTTLSLTPALPPIVDSPQAPVVFSPVTTVTLTAATPITPSAPVTPQVDSPVTPVATAVETPTLVTPAPVSKPTYSVTHIIDNPSYGSTPAGTVLDWTTAGITSIVTKTVNGVSTSVSYQGVSIQLSHNAVDYGTILYKAPYALYYTQKTGAVWTPVITSDGNLIQKSDLVVPVKN